MRPVGRVGALRVRTGALWGSEIGSSGAPRNLRHPSYQVPI